MLSSGGAISRIAQNGLRASCRRSCRASDAYAELVLSMNPVVYYRMDQWPETDKKGRYVLVDSAPGAHHGVACLDEAFGKPSCRGKFGGALDIHGSMGSDYAFVKNYPKADNGQLSVSVWVWPVVLDPWAGIVSNWYHPPTGEGDWAIRLRSQRCFGIGGADTTAGRRTSESLRTRQAVASKSVASRGLCGRRRRSAPLSQRCGDRHCSLSRHRLPTGSRVSECRLRHEQGRHGATTRECVRMERAARRDSPFSTMP